VLAFLSPPEGGLDLVTNRKGAMAFPATVMYRDVSLYLNKFGTRLRSQSTTTRWVPSLVQQDLVVILSALLSVEVDILFSPQPTGLSRRTGTHKALLDLPASLARKMTLVMRVERPHEGFLFMFFSEPPPEGTGFSYLQTGCHLTGVFRAPRAGLEAWLGDCIPFVYVLLIT